MKIISTKKHTTQLAMSTLMFCIVIVGIVVAEPFDEAMINAHQRNESFSRLAQNASPAFQAFDNYDLTGPDISVKSSIDLQACFAACQFERACQALSFDKWKKQCFLKKSAGSARFDPSLISELPVSAPLPSMAEGTITVEALPGTGFSGDAYRSATSSSLGNCELVCQNDKDCVAFTYLASQQTCKEFQTVAGYIPDHVSDSGVKRQVRITVAEPPLAPAVTPQLETKPTSVELIFLTCSCEQISCVLRGDKGIDSCTRPSVTANITIDRAQKIVTHKSLALTYSAPLTESALAYSFNTELDFMAETGSDDTIIDKQSGSFNSQIDITSNDNSASYHVKYSGKCKQIPQ